MQVHGLNSDEPSVTFDKNGESRSLSCDFVAGLRWFSRRLPLDDTGQYRQDVRAGVSVWLARRYVGDAAGVA